MEVQKANDDGTDIAELMRIFTVTDAIILKNFQKYQNEKSNSKKAKEAMRKCVI